jgi:hypothetical protein
MFGYKLRLVRKSDIRDLEIFKRSVQSIYNQCDQFIEMIQSFELNHSAVYNIKHNVERISTLVDVYFNNKFSSPANSMQMFNALDTIRTCCSHVFEVIQYSMKINESANNLSEDVDPVEAQEAYDEHRRQITYILDKEINKIIIGLKYIKSVIEYDLTKIMLGVDFITEYKKRLKRIPRDKDLLSQINIHYKILTPGDRKFIEKEKCRNAK